MHKEKFPRFWRNFLLTSGIMAAALVLSMVLARVNDDNNPFATAVFILAVALIARFTSGYAWGIAASIAGTFFVNYIFTYPFWTFNITYPGYALTAAVMLIVSMIISALTTQIKQQEQLRFEAEREKMHANLLRAIAHDIRTPLASILGASSALQEQTLSAEDQENLIDGIRRDAQWLVRVTENLLSVTRISGDISIRKEDEVLEEIIGSAVHKYRRSPEALPVLVDPQDRILIVPMDGVLIEQVLINLFDNVNAHAAGATQIWLHITTKSNRIILSVEDNGAGVDAARMSRLLEGSPASEHADSRRGMGIGLTVCRTIVRAHHGEMHVSRSAHGGLAVSFDLPYPQ